METAAAPAPYDPEAAARAQSEDEEEGHAIAREMFPLVYSYNLHKEKVGVCVCVHACAWVHVGLRTSARYCGAAEVPPRGPALPFVPSFRFLTSHSLPGRSTAARRCG